MLIVLAPVAICGLPMFLVAWFLNYVSIITDRYGHSNFTAGVLNPIPRGTSDQIDYFMSSQATQHEVFRIHPLRQVNVVFSVAVVVLLVACNRFILLQFTDFAVLFMFPFQYKFVPRAAQPWRLYNQRKP
jgi:hypothetical protein